MKKQETPKTARPKLTLNRETLLSLRQGPTLAPTEPPGCSGPAHTRPIWCR